MGIKLRNMTDRVTSKAATHLLKAKLNSPTLLLGVGIVGMTATAVLAGRATLKLSDVLEKAEEGLAQVDATTSDVEDEVKKKAKFGVKLRVAIDVAKLYAPAIIVGGATLAAITGSHVILKRRNAGLAAAYAVVDKSFKDYRGRVKAELGIDKDREFRFGVGEREIVEETETGPEVKVIKGTDQNAISDGVNWTYARVFGPGHDDWSNVPLTNVHRVQSVEKAANVALNLKGFIFLNDVYEMLGFKKTREGQLVGWVKDAKDENGETIGDGFVDLGIWNGTMADGKAWITGHKDAVLIDPNVDGEIAHLLELVQ